MVARRLNLGNFVRAFVKVVTPHRVRGLRSLTLILTRPTVLTAALPLPTARLWFQTGHRIRTRCTELAPMGSWWRMTSWHLRGLVRRYQRLKGPKRFDAGPQTTAGGISFVSSTGRLLVFARPPVGV